MLLTENSFDADSRFTHVHNYFMNAFEMELRSTRIYHLCSVLFSEGFVHICVQIIVRLHVNIFSRVVSTFVFTNWNLGLLV